MRKNPGQIKTNRCVVERRVSNDDDDDVAPRIRHGTQVGPSIFVDISIIPPFNGVVHHSLYCGQKVPQDSPDAKRKIEAPRALLYFAFTAFECRLHLLMFSLHV